MQTRLVSDLFSWLRSGFDPEQSCDPVPFLNDFSFAEGDTIAERWRVSLEVTKTADGMLQMKIPAFVPVKNISAPAGTVLVKCHIATGGCNLKNGGVTGGASTSLNFDYNDEPVAKQIISGAVWKSAGDREKRKYDFSYDAVNRLMTADFNQYTSGAFNKTAGVDFSVKIGEGIDPTLAYDANGNIKRMQQWGLTIGGSQQIDDMLYSYFTNTNKLQAVTEQGTGTIDYKLGDQLSGATGTNSLGG